MIRARLVIIYLLIASILPGALLQALTLPDVGDLFQFNVTGMLKPEFAFFNKANLLNSEALDTGWGFGTTVDLGFGINDKEHKYVEVRGVGRTKFKAGDATATSSTSKVQTKVVDSLQDAHSHASGKLFIWARELWMRWDLGKLFNLPFMGEQLFTVGLVPFQVGRGIALGDVYAAGLGLLGFYSETYVDQYAFGLLLSGDIWSDWVTYALYAGILKNKMSFKDLQEKVFTSRYGFRDHPQRGFGDINYVLAGYFDIYAMHDETFGSMRLQPYWVFNQDNGQQIEFNNDANSILGTIGLEGEYLGKYVEVGFEMAFNAGKQCAYGEDRNMVTLINNEGRISQVNSHVVAATGDQVPFIAKSDSQKAILAVPQSQCQNSQPIPGDFTQIGYLSNPTGVISNSPDRFKDPYETIYKGWMILGDTSFWLIGKDLRLSFTGGVASGGTNPHFNTQNGDYNGFVSLQEAYSGKRVKSAYYMAGKIDRPVGNPTNTLLEDNVVTDTISGFTNLVFAGAGLSWTPVSWENPIKINPNILAYWQQKTLPALLPANLASTIDGCVPQMSPYLGIEMNLFIDYNIVKNLKLYGVASVFVPGTFYTEIKSRRTAQVEAGLTQDEIPKYGDDVAWTLNLGCEYRF